MVYHLLYRRRTHIVILNGIKRPLTALPVLECIDLICELAGVNQAAQDVVGEVTES